MDSDTIWILVPLTALLIPIAAVMAKPLSRWIALQERKHELAARMADTQAAEHAANIATDRATGLAHEIETLRAPVAPLN